MITHQTIIYKVSLKKSTVFNFILIFFYGLLLFMKNLHFDLPLPCDREN